MATTDDSYTVTLNEAHLGWGTHRYTNSRERIYGEGYLPIYSHYAREYEIFNSLACEGRIDTLGINIFNAHSTDGYFEGILKAGGNSHRGDIYAKNFHGCGDLRALGNWFRQVHAEPGDNVRITWTSPNEIILEFIPQ